MPKSPRHDLDTTRISCGNFPALFDITRGQKMAKSQPILEIEPGATVEVENLTASRRYNVQNRGGFPVEYTFAADLAEAETLAWQIVRDGESFDFKEAATAAAPLFVRSSMRGWLAIRDA